MVFVILTDFSLLTFTEEGGFDILLFVDGFLLTFSFKSI